MDVWHFDNLDTAPRCSSPVVVLAIQTSGRDRVGRLSGRSRRSGWRGRYRLENRFRYLLATRD
jgi:hypothetical protein